REPEPVPAHPRGDDEPARPAPAVDHWQRIRRRVDLSRPGLLEPHGAEAGKVALHPLQAEPDVIEAGPGRQLIARGRLQGPERGPGEVRDVGPHAQLRAVGEVAGQKSPGMTDTGRVEDDLVARGGGEAQAPSHVLADEQLAGPG